MMDIIFWIGVVVTAILFFVIAIFLPRLALLLAILVVLSVPRDDVKTVLIAALALGLGLRDFYELKES